MSDAFDDDALQALYRRPGFMLRRANQIAASMFLESMARFGLTTTQYGAMTVLAARAPIDQTGLARALGLDRSTAGLVISNLERRGLVARADDARDRRRRMLVLTAAGATLLDEARSEAVAAPERLLSVLGPDERERFLHSLAKVVDAFNPVTRAPLMEP